MFSKSLLLFLVVYYLSGSTHGQKAKKFFRDDYTYIEAVDSFYKIHTTPRTWTEAKQQCALEGATLWHPDKDAEAQAVKSFWKTTQSTIDWVYVGLSDMATEGVFKTIDGRAESEVYNKWLPGQPDDGGSSQDCVYIYKDSEMDDWTCDSWYNFICKKSLQLLEPSNITHLAAQKTKMFFRDDYTYIEAVNSFYKIHRMKRTWTEAKQRCALEGATLWHPDNDAEARAVKSFWNTTQPTIEWVYVGLSDMATEGVFRTIDGRAVSEVYNKWLPGQPDDGGSSQDCVYIYKDSEMDDWSCDSWYNFICKKSLQSLEPFHDRSVCKSGGDQRTKQFFRNDYSYLESEESFFKIHTIPRTWTEAKRVCALEGATLWHPDNDDEALAVISFWNTTQPHIGWVYVGMSDVMAKGLFETVDGKSVSEVYNHWQPGKPDNYGGKQDCVYIYKEGLLDDWNCNYTYYFICKKRLESLEWNHHCNISDPGYTFNEDNGKCYKLHTTPMNWNDSYAVCRLEQSHLAVITSRQEADYLVNLTESTPNPRLKENYQRGIYHVGFHNKFKEGWQTVKGTPMNVDVDLWWGNYQPADDRDQCGSMFYTGRLIDTDCDMKSFFICEHEVANSCTELAYV